MVLICRICLAVIADCANTSKLDTVDPASGFMPYWDKLTTCVPEMALDVVIDAVMCKLCTANLETAYDFKVKCLQTEEQLRTLLQSSGRSQIDFNELLQRQRLVVPKTVIVIQRPAVKQYRPALRKRRRFQFSMKKEIKKENPTNLTPPKAEPIPIEKKVVEDAPDLTSNDIKVESSPTINNLETTEELSDEDAKTASTISKTDPSDLPLCTLCNERFPSSIHLKRHRAQKHHKHQSRTVVKCPFCERIYRSNTYLSRHIEMQHEMRCGVCGEECGDKETYRAHMIEHAKQDVASGQRRKSFLLHKRANLPLSAKKTMKKWLLAHYKHPYPTEKEKAALVEQTQLTQLQVENWFVNARRRILLPLLNTSGNGTVADGNDNTDKDT